MRIVQLFAAAIIAAIATPAAAEDIYLQVDVGGDYYPDNERNDQGFDIGPGGALGVRIGKPFGIVRGELEGGFAAANIDLENDPGDDDFSYYQFSLSAGAYVDLGPFYLGGGGGLVYQEIETEVLGIEISDSDTNFVAHGEAGVAFSVNDTVELVPHYRATWLPGFKLDDEVIVHSLRLGVRFEP